MKKNSLISVAVIILLGGGIAAYFYWQHTQPKPEPAYVQPPIPATAPNPVVQQVIEAPLAQPALPKLSESDSFMLGTLSGLVGNNSLMSLFHTKRIIHNIVATIDNLPRRSAPISVMPVKRVHGKFITEGPEKDKTISPKNGARYSAYMKIAGLIDAQRLVDAYVRLYPLFQQAYEELGYPNKYFNDRLLVALDDLLAAPDLNEPVKLIQPSVFYLYADPDLEVRSAGQKILMRMGSKNEAKIKAKLREIKQQVTLHMHDKKVDSTK
ncbi:MAG: DUF3014 domain-containing protein [Proteobacteria bacterium]|nr:DUF3014 domain-containing protein [Pseudomonadota bacterium]